MSDAPLLAEAWPDTIFAHLQRVGVRQVGYVPDAGHAHLIERCIDDPAIADVVLTTEEEGIAASCGAWLGGQRSVLLMQSSGVGNCINMLSLIENCRFPLLTLITMRGEWGEFNPWQVPMGRSVAASMSLMGVSVRRVDDSARIADEVQAGLDDAFTADQAVAILISQRMLGRKQWTR